MKNIKTSVYIDGLNLFYRALKGTPYKWLNLQSLCQNIFPNHQIVKIKYFTSKINSTKNNPAKRSRQEFYLRALRTIKNLEIIEGRHSINTVQRLCVDTTPHKLVNVKNSEEKRTDVNLASHLLCDAFLDQFDKAIIITNDSDFKEPLNLIKKYLNKRIYLLNPSKKHTPFARDLVPHVDWKKRIHLKDLQESQFPINLADSKGKFYKPPEW